MRTLARPVLALALTLVAASAQAQTYGSNYPVCLQTFGRFNAISCSFTSMAQCGWSASGRAAQCIVNPYFERPTPGRTRRQHRVS
jgi:hypothetical protein